MPQDGQYKLVFYGRILEGFNIGEVKRGLAGVLKVDDEKIDLLFAKAPVTVKKDVDYPTASKFKEALRSAGAVCEIERTVSDSVGVKPPPLDLSRQPSDSGKIHPAAAAVSESAVRPGRLWYGLAVFLLIVPATIAAIKVGATIWSQLASGIDFMAPGVTEVSVEKPNTYVIWITTDDGRSYHRDIPQDIKITVYDHRSRRSVEVKRPGWNSRETVANVQRQSIAEVVIDRPGAYTIEVNGDFPPSYLLWRRSLAAELFTSFVLPVVVGLLGFVAGLTTAVIVFIRRSKAKYRADPAALSQKQERQWAMFSHLSTFAAFLIPFSNIVAPLIIWQVKKDESAFVVQHSKESLNFQISLMIYSLAAILLVLVIIGIFLLIGLGIFNIVAVIIAGVKANEGYPYRYPMAIRFFK